MSYKVRLTVLSVAVAALFILAIVVAFQNESKVQPAEQTSTSIN